MLGILREAHQVGRARLQALTVGAGGSRQRAIALGRLHRAGGEFARDVEDPAGIVRRAAHDERLLVGALGKVAGGARHLLGRSRHLLGGRRDLLGHGGRIGRGRVDGAGEGPEGGDHVTNAPAQGGIEQHRVGFDQLAGGEVTVSHAGRDLLRCHQRPEHGPGGPGGHDQLQHHGDSQECQGVRRDVAQGAGAQRLPQDDAHGDRQ